MSTGLSICNDRDSHSSASWVNTDLCTLIIFYRRAQLGNPTIPGTNPKVPRLRDLCSFFFVSTRATDLFQHSRQGLRLWRCILYTIVGGAGRGHRMTLRWGNKGGA